MTDYSQIDQLIIEEFIGSHPEIIKDWLPQDTGLYQVDPGYKLTQKQKKHRIMIWFELLFRIDLSKKHFKLV